jgi:hypothetical protein
MKKVIRLTESELTNLVKRIVNEQMEDDGLSDHIKIYHMYKNGELDKKTFYSFVGILHRHEKERLMDYIRRQKEEMLDEEIEDVYSDSREDFEYDIRSVDCNDNVDDGHVDIDEYSGKIMIAYCNENPESLKYLKRKGRMLLKKRYEMPDFSDDEQDTLSKMRGYFGDK